MLVDLLAHGIPYETAAVTVIVSRHFQPLGNELAECHGDEIGSFSFLIKSVPYRQNADVSW
jgi:hypothetical protein